MKCEKEPSECTQPSQSGKTYPEPFPATGVEILGQSLKRSQRPKFQCLLLGGGRSPVWSEGMGVKLPGDVSMRNTGVSPNVVRESSLSSILEATVHPKYYLSPKACVGILRRAEKRGKKLPPVLEMALREQANLSSSSQEAKTGVSGFTGGGISPTLNTMQGGQRQPCVAQPTCAIRTAQTSSNGWGLTEELSYTLDLASGQAVIQPIAFNGRQDPVYGAVTGALDTDRATQCVAIQHSIIGRKDEAGAQGPGFRDDGKMFTLDSRGSAHAVAQCVTTGTGRRYDPETEALIIAGFKQGNSAKAGSIGYEVEKSPTLTAGQSGTNLVPAIVYPDPAATLRARGKTKNSNPAGQPLDNLALIPVLADQGGSQMSVSYNLAPTLRAQEHGHQPLVCSKTAPTLPAREKGGGGLGTDFDCDGGLVMAFGVRNSPKPNIGTDIMPTLLSNENAGPNQYVCGTFQNTGQGWWNEGDKAATLRTPAGGDSVKANLVSVGYAVRRLTPLECERLQGLQDGWTNIPGASDTARYRAIGNGLAIPCPEWIFKRINEVLYSDIQMAL